MPVMTPGNNAAVERRSTPNEQRRKFLVGGLVVSVVGVMPWALSTSAPDVQRAFLPVSAYLLGHEILDTALAGRLHDALSSQFPGFEGHVQGIADLIRQRTIDPLKLQGVLDTEFPALAPAPRRIVRAWAMGIVGDGANARCIAYEAALNAAVVSDVLKPPTYAYGGYGSWSNSPGSAAVQHHG